MNKHSDILSEVCYVRFGEPLLGEHKAQLFHELIIFQRSLRRAGRTTISEQAIRAWFPDNGPAGQPKRSSALEFLSVYLNAMHEKKAFPDGERTSRFHALDLALRLSETALGKEASDFVIRDAGDYFASLRLEKLDPLVLLALQVLTAASTRNKRSELDDFFRGGNLTDTSDHSYFVMYRYSTTGGNVLKTFLVVKRPRADLGSFSFNHFIWPSFNNRVQSFRECEGFVLKFDKAYYLLGYNYEIKENKRLYLQEYLKKRTASKLNPNGIGAIAVEYESIDEDLGLFGGVTMTLAAFNQPVVSRVALLHLGTKSRLGVGLNDIIVQPSEIEVSSFPSVQDAIAADLDTLIANIRSLGADRFAERLEVTLSTPDWALGLAAQIDAKIVNTPEWEARHSKNGRNVSKRDKPAGRGAIETAGKLRP